MSATRLQAYGRTRRMRGGDNWSTPQALYDALHAEFNFTFDPCPLDTNGGLPLMGTDGLAKSWMGERVFCNPPYSEIGPWLAKAREAALAVYLVPSRTGTRWWHEYALGANEILPARPSTLRRQRPRAVRFGDSGVQRHSRFLPCGGRA